MKLTLQIYETSVGQWAGIVLRDGIEMSRIAGCSSPAEVEQAALEIWDEEFDVKMI